MTFKELIAVLDRMDAELKMAFIHINQLKLFFPNENAKHLSVSLNRHVKNGVIGRICRGLYFNPRSRHIPDNPIIAIACIIRDKRDFYLSLESVLSDEKLISQTPSRLTFISKNRSETFFTPYGIIEFTKGKFDLAQMLASGELKKDSNGIYVASVQRALKDAYRHRRSIEVKDSIAIQRHR